MIDTFKVGYYYRYIGPQDRPEGWNHSGEMDYMLDREPHLCIESDGPRYARFVDDINKRDSTWSWDREHFELVEYIPPEPKEVIDNYLFAERDEEAEE